MARIRSGYPTEHNTQLTLRSPWIGNVATDSSNIWPPGCHSIAHSHNGGPSPKYKRGVQRGACIRSGQTVKSYFDDFYRRMFGTE